MDAVRQVMTNYPRIFFACHTRHVRDDQSGKVISAHQASVLDHLDELEPTALNDLARHMGVTASTMCLTVDRLERDGYVARGPDPNDGRRVALQLTTASARIRDQKTVLEPERVKGMLAHLNSAERRDALHGLELLARAAGEFIASHSKPERPAV